ncbi:hypothetical protein HRI_005203100 [Hibiscus trionum]|uniref:Uncharacterized protein n=1 Tax=Hibiscus trionum TaxID=183268 RepID=A0A9W7MU04_HIBTR|nr:hypothetical protein HRI_005203100 [Hibiscus trionum]
MNTKGSERINEEGATEIRVDTVDIQSPPGENKEPRMETVGVVHLTRDKHNTGDKGPAAEATEKAFQSSGHAHRSNK